VLPEFQGLGISGKMTNIIAELYTKNNYRFRETTSHPARISNYKKDEKWICCTHGRQGNPGNKGNGTGGTSRNRFVSSWEYVGEK
jgi:hypothetical protein